MVSKPTPPNLDYSTPPVPNRRLRRLWLLGGLLFVVALFVSRMAWPEVLERCQKYEEQRKQLKIEMQCREYLQSPAEIVFAEDPSTTTKLLRSDSSYQQCCVGCTGVTHVPSIWAEFDPSDDRDGIGFLHERVSPSGHHRLVCLVIYGRDENNDLDIAANVYSTTVGGLRCGQNTCNIFNSLPPHEMVTLFAGQSDPLDLSHFTMGYEISGKQGIIDGWLTDSEYVKLQIRGQITKQY